MSHNCNTRIAYPLCYTLEDIYGKFKFSLTLLFLVKMHSMSKVLSTMSDVMQRIIRGVEHWCNKTDLRVNPGKTVIILFIRKKPEQLRPIIFYGQQLVLTKQVKYLA